MTDRDPDRLQVEDARRSSDADEDAPPPRDVARGRPMKQKRCGTPQILSDTEGHFTFTIYRSGLASNEAIRFEKEGNESWIETVKWAQRNGKDICVRYDEREASVFWIDDEAFLVYPPTDLFESS